MCKNYESGLLKLRERFEKHISGVAVCFIILVAAFFFIYCGNVGATESIAQFSLLSAYVFLASHLASLGIDNAILAEENVSKDTERRSAIGSLLLGPIALLVLGFLIYLLLPDGVRSQLRSSVGLGPRSGISDWAAGLVFFVIVLANVYVRILTAARVAKGTRYATYPCFIGKMIGFFLGACVSLLWDEQHNPIYIIALTELVPFTYLLLRTERSFWLEQTIKYRMRYILTSFNVFSFEAIMKTDLIILSIIGNPTLVASYAIASSVFEGFIQIFASYKYRLAKNLSDGGFRLNKLENFFLCTFLGLSFAPAAIIFHYVTIGDPAIEFFLVVSILNLGLLAGVFGILSFHYLEMVGRPLTLTLITSFLVSINAIVSYLGGVEFGMLGVATGSALTYLCLSVVLLSTIATREGVSINEIRKRLK